jgi:hypothetical protein
MAKNDGVTISRQDYTNPFYAVEFFLLVANNLCSLTADGETILNLPWYPSKIEDFLTVHSISF